MRDKDVDIGQLEAILAKSEFAKVCSCCTNLMVDEQRQGKVSNELQRKYRGRLTHGYCIPCYEAKLREMYEE